MIEALMMGVGSQGPSEPWVLVNSVHSVSSSLVTSPSLPSGVQAGDLVIAAVSAQNYPGSAPEYLPMTASGWTKFGHGSGDARMDVVSVAAYRPDLPPPTWQQPIARYFRYSILIYRAKGWSGFRLESYTATNPPVTLEIKLKNTLVLVLGNTPGTSGYWYSAISGQQVRQRYNNRSTPSLYIADANVALPASIQGVRAYVSDGGAVRNVILTAL